MGSPTRMFLKGPKKEIPFLRSPMGPQGGGPWDPKEGCPWGSLGVGAYGGAVGSQVEATGPMNPWDPLASPQGTHEPLGPIGFA